MTKPDKSDRAEGVAALQQAGEPVASDLELIDLLRQLSAEGAMIHCHPWPQLEQVMDRAADRIAALSPLPQQTALVEQGIEKIIAPHEPVACGASAPSDPPRSDGGEG